MDDEKYFFYNGNMPGSARYYTNDIHNVQTMFALLENENILRKS